MTVPMAGCTSKAAASLFKRTLALSPPRGGGPGAGGCSCGRGGGGGGGGSPGTPSWGSSGRLRSGGSRLLQQPTAPPAPALSPRFLGSQPPSPPVLFLQDSLSDSLRTCYRYLNQTSRSFAAVIQALDGELRNAVCIFYLILRALDTVEDDMTINLETKVPMLQNFYSYLYQPDWKFMESKEKDKQVLEDFPTISLEFRNLAKVYRDVIAEVCHKMGLGMAEFLEKKIDSKQDWDRYCHYVAGLVGIGLSRLFSASELEDPIVGQDTELANSMGLFLQKTNIIRDYLEDQLEDREFWPSEVWSKYVKKLSDLAKPENIEKAVQCMNELITNTLHHVPDVLTYLSRLKNQSVFNFCAIPQVMAIATLAACYNNKQVFRGVVKIRKGQAVTLMMDATNMDSVKAIMHQYVEEIYQKIPATDPSSSRTQQIIASVRSMSVSSSALVSRVHYSPIYLSCVMLIAALSWQYLRTVSKTAEEYVYTGEN